MFSFSQYSCFQTCPKKYFWSYKMNLVPCAQAPSLVWGTEFHKGVAGLSDTTLPAKIGVLAGRHFGKLPGEKPEVEVIADVGHVKFKGYVDALTEDTIIEYKTTSRANAQTCNAIELSIQTRLYANILNRSKVLIRMVKKSALRQRQNETEDMFEQRVLQEYIDKPGEYFQQIELANVSRLGTIREFVQVVKMIEMCEAEECWPMSSPYACYGMSACPYLELCSDPINNLHLYREKEKE